MLGFINMVYLAKETRLQVGQSGVRIPALADIFLFFRMSRLPLQPTHSPTQWVLVFFPGVLWPGHVVENSPPHSTKVLEVGIHTSTSSICLHSINMDNITFDL